MLLIRMRIEQPFEIGKNRLKTFTREAHKIQGDFWRKNFLPDHFTRAASSKYGHRQRSAKYLRNKQRGGRRWVNGRVIQIKYGGQVDNVFSGDMEAMFKSGAAVRAFPSRVTVTMTGPRYVTMNSSRGPDKGAEITNVTAEQADVLGKLFAKEVIDRYNAWKQPKTVTIRG